VERKVLVPVDRGGAEEVLKDRRMNSRMMMRRSSSEVEEVSGKCYSRKNGPVVVCVDAIEARSSFS
jgi:hypothetical protein